MKMVRIIVVSLFIILLSAPMISGQDFSRYRNFSLGTSLVILSKQVGQDPHQANLIHQSPAVIQELSYWPIDASYSSVRMEAVSQILFSFYNGELYKMVVTYDRDAIKGLTDEDMVQAVSARYGIAKRLYPELNLPTNAVYAENETVIARWEDSQNSVKLFRFGNQNSFRLAVFSIRLDAQAKAAIIESEKLEKQEASKVEIGRLKKEDDELEVARQINQKTFRP